MANYKHEQSTYRTNMSKWEYYKTNQRTCFHVDGWIKQTADNELYFVFRTARGGWDVIEIRVFRVTLLDGAYTLLRADGDIRGAIDRQCDSAWARKYAPHLNELHKTILPQLRITPAGYKTTSIRLHYVSSDPAVDDPMEGIVNHYGATAIGQRFPAGTGARDRRRAEPSTADLIAAKPTPAKLDRRSRSIMRTLDKLLKG